MASREIKTERRQLEQCDPTVFEQLEDALIKIAPGGGAVIGGLAGAGYVQGKYPTIVGFIGGGAISAVAVGVVVYVFFLLLNPKRNRSRRE